MNDAAEIYHRTIERLASGEPLTAISTDDLKVAASGAECDAAQRLGRLNRFADARLALERVGQMSGEERTRVVRILAIREQRGHALDVDAEAALALNSAWMLETIKADIARRSRQSH